MEREQYISLKNEFSRNPYKALLELFVGSLDHYEQSAPTAFAFQAREILRNVKMAINQPPETHESYVWRHVFESWVNMKKMSAKTSQQHELDKFQAISILIAAGIPINHNEDSTHD